MNSKNSTSPKQLVLGFALLGLIVFVLYLAIKQASEWLYSAPSAVTSSLIAFTGAVIAATITSLYGKHLELKNAIAQHNRTQKLPAYEEFLDYLLNKISQGEDIDQDELKGFFLRFTSKVIIWGSDDFIKAFSRYKLESLLNSATDAPDSMGPIDSMEKLLFAIRKEFGHKNKGLESGDVMRLFINDYDEHRLRALGFVEPQAGTSEENSFE